MSVSLKYLTHCSAKTGYRVVPLEKIVRLGELAGDLARHPFLGNVLALKGGTALNLCFGPPGRLSVDLDYNYIGQAEREKMLIDRPKVESAVAEIARRQKYRIQQSADAFAGRKLYLIYRSVMGHEERLEVDLNFLFRMPLAGTVACELWQPGELDRPKVLVVSLEEILVGKMLALLDRAAARDVWDVANLPLQATEVMHAPIFRSWFIALSTILDHPLGTYTQERLKSHINDRVVAEQLQPMLMEKLVLDSSSLVKKAWTVVGRYLDLKPDEEAFLSAVQGGVLTSELIFPYDSDEALRIAGHPAIQWKIKNVRAHISKSIFKGKGPNQSSKAT
jgi:hypothetical protein